MSLLADLLSKTKKTEPLNGKDIPPTLVRAQEIASASPRLKRRFTIMSLIALTAIVIGIFLPSQLKRLSPLLSTDSVLPLPQAIRVPLPPRTSLANAPEQILQDAQKLLAATGHTTVTAPVAGGTPVPVPTPALPSPPATSAVAAKPKKQLPGAAPVKKHHIRPGTVSRPARQKPAEARDALIAPQPVAAVSKSAGAASAKIDTNARGALLYAARASEQSGDWRGALASYRAALDIDPENYRIMSNSAAAYNKLGMFPDGEREARRALSRKPDYVPALINAAIACSSQGNHKEALRFFKIATTAEPGNRSLAINLGVMQERTGNMDEALATYQRAAASGDPQALFCVARIQEQKGNKSEAIAAYKQIMQQKDANPSLKREVKERLLKLEE